MQVACRCGQEFTIAADQYPHRVSCHVCGMHFDVARDGSIAELPGVEPISVDAKCQCGQPFTVQGEQFPRHVHCHACGRHFSVLDDGQTIDAVDDRIRAAAPPPVASTAIKAAPVTAITRELFEVRADNDSEEAKRRAEVKLIDYMWNLERQQYSLFPFFGIEVMPSKLGAAAMGSVLLLGWCLFATALVVLDFPFLFCTGGSVFFLTTVAYPLNVFWWAHDYEKAELAWQLKRAAAVAKCHSLTQDE
jgi:hypothetical protein